MIYFDNAATTRPDEECVQKAEKYLYENFYNPSALYSAGFGVQNELSTARRNIISTIADEENFSFIFTSCGTEADNQALFCGAKRGNIVITEGEHSAVYSTAKELALRGTEVKFAKLNGDGSVNISDLLSLIDDKTSLVSVIHVNNETGAINDISEIAKAVKQKFPRVLFHSDGVQAYGKIPFKLNKYIDMYSVSAHKIGALKGCGGLFIKKDLKIKPYIYGGGQESNLRSGTENVFGIKTFEFAAQKKYGAIKENFGKVKRIQTVLYDRLDKSLFKRISPENGSPYILTVAVSGVRGETILHEVDDRGLIIGTGSACSSNEKMRHSRVILACGVSEEFIDGVLRLSFSSENTEEEACAAAEILNEIVKRRKDLMA